MLRYIFLFFIVGIIAACGGGGSSTPATPSMAGVTVSYGAAPFIVNANAMRTPTITGAPSGTAIFAVTAGSLPAGIVLNSATGELSGMPTTTGTVNFTITMTVAGATGSSVNSIVITVANPPITGAFSYAPASLTRATVSTINTSTNTLPLGATFTATNLPVGLTIASSTGIISGTPTSSGTFDITVTASAPNFSGAATAHATGTISDPQIGTITINFSYPSSTTATRSSVTATTITPTISGIPSGASATYALPAGVNLPTGFTLNTTTGVISGTTSSAPSSGPYNFNVNVRVSGYSGVSGSGVSSIVIVNPPNYLEWTQVSASSGISAPVGSPNFPGSRMAAIGNDLYVVTANNTNTQVWKSANNGVTWALFNTDNNLKFYSYAIAANGTNLVLIGGVTNTTPLSYNPAVRTLDVSTATATTAWTTGATTPFTLVEHSVVKQGGSYYITGGWTGAVFTNAVYTSTDAQNWTAVTVTAPFGARSQHCSFTDGTNLYVYGGEKSVASGNMSVPQMQYDLLKSTDLGVTWSAVKASVHVGGALNPICAVLNGRIVLAMGGSRTSFFDNNPIGIKTVDSSTDNGVTWSATPATPAQSSSPSLTSSNAAYAILNGALYATMFNSNIFIYNDAWKLAQ